jgi:hypothetical protein
MNPLVNNCYYAFKNASIDNKIQQCINMYKVEFYTNNLHQVAGQILVPPQQNSRKLLVDYKKTMKNRVVRDEAPGEGKFQL